MYAGNWDAGSVHGALKLTGRNMRPYYSSGGLGGSIVGFDASGSNPTYGRASVVRGPCLTTHFLLQAF